MKNAKTKTKTADFKFQLKKVSDDGTFEGYAAVFDNVDYGGDIIAPGAFAETIAEIEKSGRKLVMLWQHNADQPIGVFDKVVEDSKGLFVQGRLLLEVEKAAEALALLKGGAISGLSIGYGCDVYEMDTETWVRTLKQVSLWEVSLVTFPMNDEARVDAVKKRIASGDLPESIKDFEKFLRDAGFSVSNAKAIAGHGIRGLLRDASDETDDQAKSVVSILKNFSIPT